jgi:hypothetical protein
MPRRTWGNVMTPIDFSRPPYSFFAPPGSVDISPSALALARAFLEKASRSQPELRWVVAFDWADERRVREKGSNTWTDLGPGIDLAAYQEDDLPGGVAEIVDGIMVALKIPGHLAQGDARRRIERDDSLMSGLRLE